MDIKYYAVSVTPVVTDPHKRKELVDEMREANIYGAEFNTKETATSAIAVGLGGDERFIVIGVLA